MIPFMLVPPNLGRSPRPAPGLTVRRHLSVRGYPSTTHSREPSPASLEDPSPDRIPMRRDRWRGGGHGPVGMVPGGWRKGPASSAASPGEDPSRIYLSEIGL